MKRDVRNLCLSYRLSLSPYLRSLYDRIIMERLKSLILNVNPGSVGLYYPIKGEPDLRNIVPFISALSREVYFPVVRGDNLEWGRFDSWERGVIGFRGIWEPSGPHDAVPELVVVPGLGFDLAGYRVGYGGGYFDRFLGEHEVFSVGVVYDRCIFPKFEFVEKHDVKVDLVISEKRMAGESVWSRKKEVK